MKHLFIALFYCLFLEQCTSQTTDMQKITKNGMTVSWKIEGQLLRISMSSPNTGWVAVGFNLSDDLAGTNLIMAAVVNGKATVSDRYIVAAGDHRSVSDLGGTPSVKLISGEENATGTRITFTLPLQSVDKFHHNLAAGKTYNLLMAYSLEDDFQHHSIMRTSTKIKL